MKIFISYRRKDSAREVGRIRDRLKAAFGQENVFRDLVDIPSGMDFRTVLERETRDCEVMLVIIGPLWAGITDDQGNKRLSKPGDWTRIEVETGLRRLTSGTVSVFPVLVQNASMPSTGELPESIRPLTHQNAISIHDDPYFEFDMDRLIRDIRALKFYHPVENREYFEPETAYIPEGAFWMGSNPGDGIPVHETPRHEVHLPAYCIGKYPVTNSQYEEFIAQTQTRVMPIMGWEGQRVPQGLGQHPVTGVTWYEARKYCDWLSQVTHREYSLPNEAQWEKASRGGDDCLYPWGNEKDAARSNHGKSQLSAVDAYPAQNAYGCFDLVGNVRQWTSSLWGERPMSPDFKYPWTDRDGRNNLSANSQLRRVVRGSSFTDETQYLRSSARSGQLPENAGVLGTRCGFRVVMKIPDR